MTNKTIHLEYTSVLAVNFPLDNKICLIYTKIMNINFLPGNVLHIFLFSCFYFPVSQNLCQGGRICIFPALEYRPYQGRSTVCFFSDISKELRTVLGI